MKKINIFSIISLSLLSSSFLIAYSSDNKEDFLDPSLINHRPTLNVSSGSVGEGEENDLLSPLGSSGEGYCSFEQSSEEETPDSLFSTTPNTKNEKQPLTSLQESKREKPVCNCKKKENNNEASESYLSLTPQIARRVLAGVVNILSLSNWKNQEANYYDELAKATSLQINTEKYEETTPNNSRRKSVNSKSLVEHRNSIIEGKIARRIEEEIENPRKMTQEEKEDIINCFKGFQKLATQTQVFELMRTANLQPDAKEFVYKSIYYLFLLDAPHHPFKTVNDGWLCIRDRLEAADHGRNQMQQISSSPLDSHLELIMKIDKEFGEKVEDLKLFND